MIRNKERLRSVFIGTNFNDARSLWVERARLESGRIAGFKQSMLDNGFELVDATPNALLMNDGREILRAYGQSWALTPEVHAQRLADAVEQAKQRDAAMAQQQPAQPTPHPTTCHALIDGQLCGGTLVKASVCPRCALGKQGVAAALTCDVCGHVTAIMRGDK